VFSKTEEDHRRHLQKTLTRLRAAHLTANAEKCEFGKTDIEFLGHTVSASGIAPLPSRVAAIAAHPRGRPPGVPPKKTAVEWTAERGTAFKATRATLGKATNLAYPKMGADLGLMVDASADHVGAALQQRTGPAAGWQSLGFFSKKLDQTQQCYSAYDRELLA